jgi:O-6-methylguanine DNA methyltransferase
MKTRRPHTDIVVRKRLHSVLHGPAAKDLSHSRARLRKWFIEEAPLIQWDEMKSPLGTLFAAVSDHGLCALDFGRSEREFLDRFDPEARLEKNPKAVQDVMAQLRDYFDGDRSNFDLPVDLTALTPFQRSVLDIACRIAPGQVWTYHRIAKELGRPDCSRPVGQALAHNPVPIVVPCHRVIASNGSLGGYSGGSGLQAKRWLLRLEGAM